MFRSIHETTSRLQRLMEVYQDRICFLAGEENALGRFLKEHGKSDRTRAGKMMVAAGKTMSYTGQQRLAIRVPLVRLYQEVDTFRLRAIEDTRWTVESMEKARTEYRGALLWMKNVSTELDPDTFKQLEKFRKVQAHVKASKQKFDKLKLDCLQKIDLLAASRCNMFSHALIMYQNTLVNFWDKTSKTMNHVNNGFKGYQYYEFNYIKDLASSSRQLAAALEENKKENKRDIASFPEKTKNVDFQFFHLDEENSISKKDSRAENTKSGSLHNLLNLDNEPPNIPSLDENDEILLKIDSELENDVPGLKSIEDIFKKCPSQDQGQGKQEVGELLWPTNKESETLLDELLASTSDTPGGFTAEWDRAFQGTGDQRRDGDQLVDLMSSTNSSEPSQRSKSSSQQSFLPSQLFHTAPRQPVSTPPSAPTKGKGTSVCVELSDVCLQEMDNRRQKRI